MVDYVVFPDNQIKIVMVVLYYRGKTLEWIQPYVIKLLEKK